jgi:hypothetical protein
MLGAFLLTWILGRIVEAIREPLAIVGGLVTRVGLGILLVLVAVDAARHGGFWWLLVPVVPAPELFNFGLSAAIVWAWAHEKPSEQPA